MDRLFDLGDVTPPPHTPRVTHSDITTVFEHWIRKHHTRGPKPQMSPLRRRRIHDAIRDYGIATTLAAIDGCLLSEWHMGANPRGHRYNDVSLILRDASHIERFAALADGDDDPAAGFLRDA